MSVENNVRAVKDFFAALGSGDKEHVLPWVLKTSNGLFQERTGPWLVRIADTRGWRMCFRRLPRQWNDVPEAS